MSRWWGCWDESGKNKFFQKMLNEVVKVVKMISADVLLKADLKQEIKELVASCILYFFMRSTFKNYHQSCIFHLILIGFSSSLVLSITALLAGNDTLTKTNTQDRKRFITQSKYTIF